MNHANNSKLHVNLVAECIENHPLSSEQGINNGTCPVDRLSNCHKRRSIKLLCVFHRRMVSLEYHVHCDRNKMTHRLFISLDSRFKVAVAKWPLWCFPLPTDTDTRAFTDPWSARARVNPDTQRVHNIRAPRPCPSHWFILIPRSTSAQCAPIIRTSQKSLGDYYMLVFLNRRS